MSWRVQTLSCAMLAGLIGCIPTDRAQAQISSGTTYVANLGSDNNIDCSNGSVGGQFAPCRLIQTAHNRTDDGGTIICLDNSSFGTATFTKSITLSCTPGSIVGALSINAPGKTVRLRNLLVRGSIEILAADSVDLDNVILDVIGPSAFGIRDARTGGKLALRNSKIANSPGPGIVTVPQGGLISAVLDNVTVQDSAYGVAAAINSRIFINRSVLSGNGTSGVHADTGAIIDINDTLIASNATGIFASQGSAVSLSDSRINSNNTGISGTTRSFGNNRFVANAASDGTVPTPVGATSSENGMR